MRRVAVNPIDGFFHCFHYFDRHNIVKKLGTVIFFGCQNSIFKHTQYFLIGSKFDRMYFGNGFFQFGQKRLRYLFMNNQRFSGITHARTLRFGVHDNIDRHLQIGTVVHINMAITDPGFNDGNFRFLFHRLNQACAAAWNQHINIINRLHQFLGGGMTGIFNQLHHIGIHSCFYQSLPDDGNQCGI